MEKKKYIGWLAGAAMLASLSGCIDDKDGLSQPDITPQAQEKYSTILLNIMPPEGHSLTRADVDTEGVNALDNEDRMYSIKVWAFVSEGQGTRNVTYSYVDENGNTGTATKETMAPSDPRLNLSTDHPVAYVEFEHKTGSIELQQLQLSIPSVILENFLKLDLYATANSQDYLAMTTENPYGEITSNATRQQIEAAVLKHDAGQTDEKRQDPFGLTSLVRGPQTEGFVGLPMSYVQKNVDFYNEVTGESNIMYDYLENKFYFNKEYVHPITLKRVVSKFRFIFTRSEGTVTDAQINKIEIGKLDGEGNVVGGAFANTVYQLPTMDGNEPAVRATNLNTADGYDDRSITFVNEDGTPLLATADIMETQDVYKYMYQDGMSAQEYQDLLLANSYDYEIEGSSSEGKELTMYGRTYLRETDQQLGGKIYYTINGTEKTATFQMAEAGDFSRNHLWVIYAYFEGGGLYVKPDLLPWSHDDSDNINTRELFEMETGSDVHITVYKNETLGVDGSWLKYTDKNIADEEQNTYIAMAWSEDIQGGFSQNPAENPEGSSASTGFIFNGNPLEMTTNSPLMRMQYRSSRKLYMSRFAPHFLFLYVEATDDCYDTAGNLISVPTTGWKVRDHIDTMDDPDNQGDFFFYVIPDWQFTPGNEARENTIVVSESAGSDKLMPGNIGINQNFVLPGMLYNIRFKYVTNYAVEDTADYTIEKIEQE